jgi:hypothetical protein
MRRFAIFSVAKVVKTFGPEPGMSESLDDFRYKNDASRSQIHIDRRLAIDYA